MKTASCKAKGRALQKEVVAKLIERFGLSANDIKSLPMGAQGEDVWLSDAARSKFPFSIECKNVEKLNVWAGYKQACDNAGPHIPLLVHSKNRAETLATLRLDDLLKLLVG